MDEEQMFEAPIKLNQEKFDPPLPEKAKSIAKYSNDT